MCRVWERVRNIISGNQLKDQAKHLFLFKAGIDDGQLSIVLEPEAASLLYQMIPTDRMMGSESFQLEMARIGTKFMVIALGGKFLLVIWNGDLNKGDFYVCKVFCRMV